MKYDARLPDESVNYSSEHPLMEFLKVGGSIVAILLILYFVLGWSIDLLIRYISPSFEQKIEHFIEPKLGLNNMKGISVFGEKFESCVNLPYQLHIKLSQSKEVNAYALPGGTIVINEGFLEQCKSENELFFVIGHELGHLKHRDHLRGLGRSLIGLSLAALVGPSEATNILSESIQFGESRFSQAQELAADRYGLAFLQCYYKHVGGATDFFERQKKNDYSKWFLFASHPELVERIKHIKEQIATNQYTKKTTIPFDPQAFISK